MRSKGSFFKRLLKNTVLACRPPFLRKRFLIHIKSEVIVKNSVCWKTSDVKGSRELLPSAEKHPSKLNTVLHHCLPVAATRFFHFFPWLVTRAILLWSVCCLAVKVVVGGTAGLIQPIRDMFEGALDCGHQRLHGLQLLRGGVDGGVLRHDVAVIVAEGTKGPLEGREI